MVILINPKSAAGSAQRKWKRIEQSIRRQLPQAEVFVINGKMSPVEFLIKKIEQGHHEFIAAGGDGTVNWLLQTLMDRLDEGATSELKIGAIGLGSSNDFQKPFDRQRMLQSVPFKIDFNSADFQDVGVLTFEDAKGNRHRRFWINNASVGITAEANAYFNSSNRFLNWLKERATGLAIVYAALRTIFTYKNMPMRLGFAGDEIKTVNLTNLGVVKNPHFSGSFRYDSPYEKNSGMFYCHLCYDMSLRQTLQTLWHLAHGTFSGLPNTVSFRLNRLTVSANQPFAVEYDGETIRTKRAEFGIIKQAIKVCQK